MSEKIFGAPIRRHVFRDADNPIFGGILNGQHRSLVFLESFHPSASVNHPPTDFAVLRY